MGFMTVDESTYMPINGFTTVDLGCERGNNAYYPVQKTESFENANYFLSSSNSSGMTRRSYRKSLTS
mgnify:CR=1 FL=1